jgi:quinol monooxygenase YgiN
MVTFQFNHFVKPEFIEEYIAAVLEDARESIKEEGILRFEFFQNQDDPTQFTLLEVYRDLQAREIHKQAPYLIRLKETLAGRGMFSKASEQVQFNLLFPDSLSNE